MHKKLESELVSIAHNILRMKNKDDVVALKEKAQKLYEKLAVLEFLDKSVATNIATEEEKEVVLKKMDTPVVAEVKVVEEKQPVVATPVQEETIQEEQKETVTVKETIVETKKEIVVEKEEVVSEVVEEVPQTNEIEKEEIKDLFSLTQKTTEVEVNKTSKKSLEEEFQGTIPLDVATDIFEKAVRVETTKKTLNDTLVRSNLQIGLNDRIAFVKHLFEGSQEDFNRVLSQLNSFKSEKEAKKFVAKMVKPDYDWSGKEEYEERFITLITRKFA